MKVIIERKSYNTETATKIAEWDNGRYRNDFSAIEETLYKTKKGQYFLHGWGGAATSYAKTFGNSSSEGESIKLLSENEAIDWLSLHGKVDEIEMYFGDCIEEG
ncbi:MAG: hypothetical protein MK076_00105 [Flavobacteriales bacterium]|nr:hypothetical protein [Flavobacteriales bacterium]